MTLSQLQQQIAQIYLHRDQQRGLERTFIWFVEEVGELARSLKTEIRDTDELHQEFSDVLAWLLSVANLAKVDMELAMQRYIDNCPKCKASSCQCK